MPAWTIKDTLNHVRTLMRASNGRTITVNVKEPQPNPQPCAMADIETMWPLLAGWSRQWLVLSYWTCLRLEDSVAFQLQVEPAARLLTWTASKTQWIHRYPVAPWLRPWMLPSAVS